jgi:hypothetical protein
MDKAMKVITIDEVAETHAIAVNPLDLPSQVFSEGLTRRGDNRKALMSWVKEAMVDGVDFGRIQTKRGLSKPSLWKPGAEKICGMLGITAHFPTLKDWEQVVLSGNEINNVIIRCELHDAQGHVVAGGVGARNLQKEYGDLNKCLKMAEKSAHIDATLRMAGLSEVFTQDLEDMNLTAHDMQPPVNTQPVKPNVISEAQRKRLEARIHELRLDRQRVKDWITKATKGGVTHFKDLNKVQYKKLDEMLVLWAKETKPKPEPIKEQVCQAERDWNRTHPNRGWRSS